MDEEEEEPEKNTVSEEDVLSQVGLFQVPQHHEIIPLSILGSVLLCFIIKPILGNRYGPGVIP